MAPIIVVSALSLLGVVLLFARVVPSLRTEVLRDELYCIRNTLFIEMIRDGVDLKDPAYIRTRERVNGLIWMAKGLSFGLAVLCARAAHGQGFLEADDHAADHGSGIAPTPVARAEESVMHTLTRFLFDYSLSGLLVGKPWQMMRALLAHEPQARERSTKRLLSMVYKYAARFSAMEEQPIPV